MTKADLKPGYLVVRRDGERCIVMPTVDDLVLARDYDPISKCNHYYRISEYTDDLRDEDNDTEFDAMEVYGVSRYDSQVFNNTTVDRDLLWKREEPKELTVDEISKLLGYQVKVVGNN